MRLADIRRARERLQDEGHNWGVRIQRVAFQDVPGIASGEALVTGPLFLVAGPNSVGKSTLLRAIYTAAVATSGADRAGWDEIIAGGSVSLELSVKGREFIAAVEVSGTALGTTERHDCAVVHIDGARIVQEFHLLFPRESNLEELVSGDPQRILS